MIFGGTLLLFNFERLFNIPQHLGEGGSVLVSGGVSYHFVVIINFERFENY